MHSKPGVSAKAGPSQPPSVAPQPVFLPAKTSRTAQPAPLPKLANGAALAGLIGRELAACRRFGTRLAVLMIEVDALDERRAELDAALMQTLLQAFGARLRARLRGSDIVVRLGEQGFAAVLLGASPRDVPTVQARLLKALGGPYGIDEHLIYLDLRIGSAAYPDGSLTGLDLVRAAEQALD